MKLDTLKVLAEKDDEGVTITIYDRAGEAYKASDGTDATMTVVGSESKTYRKAKLDQSRKMMKRLRSGARDVPVEQAELDAQKLAASAVTAWHGWEDDKEKPLPCTVDNVLKVVAYDHIYSQVQQAIQGHAGFFTGDSDS